MTNPKHVYLLSNSPYVTSYRRMFSQLRICIDLPIHIPQRRIHPMQHHRGSTAIIPRKAKKILSKFKEIQSKTHNKRLKFNHADYTHSRQKKFRFGITGLLLDNHSWIRDTIRITDGNRNHVTNADILFVQLRSYELCATNTCLDHTTSLVKSILHFRSDIMY